MSPKKQCYYHIPFTDIMASPHQNDITGIMCGWPVYMIQTLSFTEKKWRVYARHMAIKGHT